MICPKCRKRAANRDERKGFVDNTLNRFYIKPWKCSACGNRFHALREDVNKVTVGLELQDRARRFRMKNFGSRGRRELYMYCFAALMFATIIYYMLGMKSGG